MRVLFFSLFPSPDYISTCSSAGRVSEPKFPAIPAGSAAFDVHYEQQTLILLLTESKQQGICPDLLSGSRSEQVNSPLSERKRRVALKAP